MKDSSTLRSVLRYQVREKGETLLKLGGTTYFTSYAIA